MKTQQELQLYYWGPHYDMVKEYNAKYLCDVKPWDCVKWRGISSHDDHPGFNDSEYTFALAILYDDKRKEHRPVWEDDKLWNPALSTNVFAKGWSSKQIERFSWNPPTPKRTFKLNDMELPCPEDIKQGWQVVVTTGPFWHSFSFKDEGDALSVNHAITNLLTAARDKE